MTIVIAGSRSISEGHVQYNGRWVWDQAVADHNLSVLEEAISRSGWQTTVVNMHVFKGSCTKVDRSSPFGNPFTHLNGPTLAKYKVATRDEAIERYKDWFIDQPQLIVRLPELRGKVLGCWCIRGTSTEVGCHASWLAELAGRIELVVSGTARGVDSLGEAWATKNSIPIKHMPADWNGLGRSAGYRRNTAMCEKADGGIFLTTGSNGTAHCISEMRRLGKQVFVQHVIMDEAYAHVID